MSSFRPVATSGPSSAASSSAPISTTVGGPKPFSPPLFGSFGKKAKDLFKKKYEFENQAKFVANTVDGNNVETSVIATGGNGVRGVFKSVIPVRSLGVLSGTFESEFHTVADRESRTSYKLGRLYRGLNVKLSLVGVKPDAKAEADFPEGWAQVEADYAQEYVSTNVGVRTNGQKTLVDATAAVGYDNLSVGAKVVVDVASKAAPTDYNFGAELLGADYVATAVTEKKRSVLTLSYFQTLSSKQSVGVQASFGLVKPSRTLQVGIDHKLDVDTMVRGFAKVDSAKDTTVLAANVEHRLLSPNVLLGVSAEFNVAPTAVSASKLGVNLTFGDF